MTPSFESHVREAIERGQLVSILEEFCAPFPGYYLYYPQRRHASRALRALVDYLRRAKQGRRSKRSRRASADAEKRQSR